MQTMIGLLAAYGVRGGGGVALDRGHLSVDPAVLRVRGKYARQRLVPIHPSPLEALSDYQSVRAALTGRPPAGPLLVGARGGRLSANVARSIFRRVADDCALPARPGNPTPRLHDLTHTFADNSLIDAHRQRVDVFARLAQLATYLGHVNPASHLLVPHRQPGADGPGLRPDD